LISKETSQKHVDVEKVSIVPLSLFLIKFTDVCCRHNMRTLIFCDKDKLFAENCRHNC